MHCKLFLHVTCKYGNSNKNNCRKPEYLITYALLQVLIKRHESDYPVTTCWHLSGCSHP